MTNNRLCAASVVLLSLTLLLPVRAFAAESGADNKPFTAVIDQLLDAWNKRDSAKFAAAFTEDGDFINPRGGSVHGRKAISEIVAKLVSQAKTGSQAKRLDAAVKRIKPDVALVLSNLSITSGGKTDNSLATLVLVNAGGKWKISACEIAAGAAPAGRK